MVKVVKKIVQFSTEAETFNFRDKKLQAESLGDVRDTAQGWSEDYDLRMFKAVQNPVPKVGMAGLITPQDPLYEEDISYWSDSPRNDPLRSDTRRFAFGRYGEGIRYRNLDIYHGLVIRERFYTKESNYNQIDDIKFNQGFVFDKQMSPTGEYLQTTLLSRSTFTYLKQYPFIQEALPVPYSYKNPIDTDIYLLLGNYSSELDENNVKLYVNGILQSDVIVQVFHAGIGGLSLYWENPSFFNYGEEVKVSWVVGDKTDPTNYIYFEYLFYTVNDLMGPRIIEQSPTNQSVDNNVDTSIYFLVKDFESALNLASIELFINNLEISSDQYIVNLVDAGFELIFVPEYSFLYGDKIPGSIYVEDVKGNSLYHVFYFCTESSPQIISVGSYPLPGSIKIPINAGVYVDLISGGGGISLDSLVLAVDGKQIDFPLIYQICYRGH